MIVETHKTIEVKHKFIEKYINEKGEIKNRIV